MRAAIFDVDGTLVDLFDLHLKGFQEVVAEEYELTFEKEDLERYYGRTGEEILREFFKKHGIQGVDLPLIAAKRRQRFISNIDSCKILPGVKKLLAELKDAKILLAVGSSNPRDIGEAIMQFCGLASYFPVRVYKSGSMRGKPAPDIFLEAAKRLKVKPAMCVVIEDSVHGIQAAKAAHMRVVAVATGKHTVGELSAEGPDLIALSLESLDLPAIEKLFKTEG